MKIGAIQNRISLAAPASKTGNVSKNLKVDNIYYDNDGSSSYSVLSFTGAAAAAKNPLSITHLAAEMPDWIKVGGVGTVVNDYAEMPAWIEKFKEKYPEINEALKTNQAEVNIIVPYYNGNTIAKENSVQVHTINGQPYFISNDLWKKFAYDPVGLSEHITDNPKQYAKLNKVASSTINWGMQKDVPVELYEIVDHPQLTELNKRLGGNKAHFFMEFTPEAALMPTAYADGSYSSVPKSPKMDAAQKTLPGNGLRGIAKDDVIKSIDGQFTPQGVPYMQFSKGAVELIEKAGINSKTIILSDSQAAMAAEYVAQLQKEGSEFWKDCKTTGVLHNLGPGYCGETSAKNIALAIMSPEQIKASTDTSLYKQACLMGREDDFWKLLIPGFIDDRGSANPVLSIMHNCIRKDTVSAGYAEALANNPEISSIYSTWVKQYKDGNAGGILNGLDTAGIAAHKPLPFKYYTQDVNIGDVEFNGLELKDKIIQAFRTYDSPDKITYESMLEVKKHNKKSLLERLAYAADRAELISGLDGKSCEIYGSIDPAFVSDEKTTLFVSWGRGDFQKGHDNVINAWSKFAQTKEGKNAVLVLGGQLDMTQDESKKIAKLVNEAITNPKLSGRIAFVNGFAPGYAFSSAADFAVFGSRFEPCGLTDPEAWKYYANTILPNTQGFAQKNFDLRDAGDSGFAFKTYNEFYLPQEKQNFVINKFALLDKIPENELKDIKSKLIEMFPNSCGEDGNDLSLFEDFGKKYKDLYSKIEKKIYGSVPGNLLKESTENALLSSDEYKDLIRNFRDRIQVDELSFAMKRATAANKDTDAAKQIFENLLKINTSWTGNAMFNKEGVSSSELYLTKHIIAPVPKTVNPLFNFDSDISKHPGVTGLFGECDNVGAALKECVSEAGDSFSTTIKENSQDKIKTLGVSASQGGLKSFVSKIANNIADKKLLAVITGVVAIFGTVAYLDHKDKKKAAKIAPSAGLNTANDVKSSSGVVSAGVVSADNKFASYFNA